MPSDSLTGRRLTNEEKERYWRDGYAIVPIDAEDAIARARDDDGEPIFSGGVEHYFRNNSEALWYGGQVWRGLLRAMDSLPASCISPTPEGDGDEAIHGRGAAGD